MTIVEAIIVNITVFQNVMSCSLVGAYQHFRGTFCFIFKIGEYATESKIIQMEERQEWDQS
jgi:hypothetical protein